MVKGFFHAATILVATALVLTGAELRIPLWSAGDSGLAANQVHGRIDGLDAAVVDLQGPDDPIVLIVVMDTVGALARVDAARTALLGHIETMGPEWRVALLQAQDGLRVVTDPTADLDRLRTGVEGTPVSGTPGLLDAVTPAADIAQKVLDESHVRVAVLFVTDGSITDYRGDYGAAVVNPSDRGDLSRRFRDRVIQERVSTILGTLDTLSAPLFFVHLQERNGGLDVAYQNGIRRLAEATGGGSYFARAVADVESAIDSALQRISTHYSVHLDVPDGEAGPFAIELSVDGGAELSYRRSLEISLIDED